MQAVFRGGRGCTLCWYQSWSGASLPGSTGFDGIKGLSRAAEVCYWERLGEGTGESTAAIVVEALGLNESWRISKVLQHKESPGEATDESAARKQQQTPAL